MFIDIIFLALLVIAIIRGWSRGFIIAVFSVLALLAGLAAAIKLSAVTAERLRDTVHVSAKWLPFVAFGLVFLIVALLVRLAAGALQKTAEFALMGWANKLAGIVLYMAWYTILLSVLLFYAVKLDILRKDTIAASRSYPFIAPLGPRIINALGALVPFFKDMFQQLENFFAGFSGRIRP